MIRRTLQLSLLAAAAGLACSAHAAEIAGQRDAIARLSVQTGATSMVSIDNATGAARFVRSASASTKLSRPAAARAMATDAGKHAASTQFLTEYASLFGISDVASELVSSRIEADRQGGTHLTYKQLYKGLPVFGAELKTHFDASNGLTVVNGTFVPGIQLSTTPTRSAAEASAAAIARVKADASEKSSAANLARITASTPTLMVYREGLAQGVEGANRLVYKVEVGNRLDVRDFVFVDANTLKVVDKISGIHDAKNRRAFDGASSTAEPGPNYPANPLWVEGQALPTGTTEADNMIYASGEVYDLFKNAFGRDSYDGAGARMDSIFNRGWGCVNASWNGTYISFCPGTTTDDVTAHEWGHAYTEYTHGLIYAWQPGALNEAYSDIWGETVDRINGRGGDTPSNPRTPGVCSVAQPLQSVTVSTPASIAGVKAAGTAAWGPQSFTLSGTVAGVDIGGATPGCSALPAGSLTGKIAFIDRGSCGFSVKALNAQNAGAIGVIIGNNAGATTVINMSTTAGSVPTIPSLSVTQNDGTAIKTALAAGAVTVTLNRTTGAPSYDNVRWLMGEDSTAFGGAIRDMYNPTCYSNPGKVSDSQYACSTADGGGVHTNSGVPNHGYALIVDGGSYNGQNVTGIGLTKAAHIYWRAQTVYQGPASGFAAHADAVEQSCRDLTGVNLASLTSGSPSGEVITSADCSQVAAAMLAVEMRNTPTQCAFTPLLAQTPPALCASGTATAIASDGFDGGKKAGIKWLVGHTGPANFSASDWGVTSALPAGRTGYAMFAADRDIGSCATGSNAASLQRLESAEITIPAGATTLRMAFDHWVSTEATYDGGNVKISVNGGAWQLISAANFVYNPYNGTLVTAAAGNDNPLAGEAAFTGSDGGSVNGTWGRSIINLAPYAVPGDKIKLRFEMGTDCGGGRFGWYVDDVQVYRCTAP